MSERTPREAAIRVRERLALFIAPTLRARLPNWKPKGRDEYSMREWNALSIDQRLRVLEADPEPQPVALPKRQRRTA